MKKRIGMLVVTASLLSSVLSGCTIGDTEYVLDMNDVGRDDVFSINGIDCTKEENKEYREMLKRGESLPDGVYKYEDSLDDELGFYTIYIPEMTSEETKEYILLKQYGELRTIKKCMVFFTVLAILSIVLSVLALS